MNPYSRIQPGQMQPAAAPSQRPQTSAGMGPYAQRVQARPMQRPTFQSQPLQRPAGDTNSGGMLAGIMGGLSDKRSKDEIARLESANDALTQALSTKTEYPQYEAGQEQSRPPMQARFADTPAANTVAAQNVGLQQQGAPPPMQPSPQQANFGRSTSPAFQGVGGAPPDLSALDEAYRRMGQGG